MHGTGAGTGGARAVVGQARRPSSARPAVVGVLLVIAVLASALAGPWSPEFAPGGPVTVRETADPPVEPTAEPTVSPVVEDQQPPMGRETVAWAGFLLITAALVALALLLRRFAGGGRRGIDAGTDDTAAPPGPGTAAVGVDVPDVDALREGVAAAAAHLAGAGRPVDAVIAAWVRLEEAAAASGLPRDPAATPTEFTLAVLDRTRADRGASRVLLDLYLRARFGEEHLTVDDVASARAAVATLAAALAPDDGAPR